MKFIYSFFICLIVLISSARAEERIISIGGDVTEIIYALGMGELLVGRDNTSLFPERVKDVPDIGYMRQLNIEGILALKPTQVISSEVAQPAVVFDQLKAAGINVNTVSFGYTVESVVKKINQIGGNLNKITQASILANKFMNEIKAIPRSPLNVRVLFILNQAGTNQIAAGKNTVADEAIKLIGAKNAIENSVRFIPLSQEGLIAVNPDIIVMTHMGIKHLGTIDKVWSLAGIGQTNAGRHKRLLVVDDLSLMSFGLTTPSVLLQLRRAAENVQIDE